MNSGVNPAEWRRRYTARLSELWPDLTQRRLDELANPEAIRDLAAFYPDNPELAAEDEAESVGACE